MAVLTPPLPAAAQAAPLTAPRARTVRSRPAWVSVPLRFLLPAVFVAAWWIGSATGAVSERVIAGPPAVWTAFTELLGNGQLIDFATASFVRAALGVGIGVSAGLLLGLVSGLSALGEQLVDSTMQILRAVPFLALVPLFIAWFGIDELYKILLIAVATVAPMYAYTYLGVRNVDRKMVEAARGFGLSGPRLVREVVLPSALPGVLMALRVCLSISITGLIAAEQVGTREGVGYLVTLAQEYNRTDYMVLCVVLYALLGLIFDGLVRLLERFAMPWRKQVAIR
ncbi:ABC transporter permease [Nocardia cyriacigeorgica]|jgi:sulfonate transport system permease protein|uniref:ABC transporter permease n=1 Tax=Nocardia cyriacigeorgica TaxID=135487 RepID=UPI000CEA4912|nr:ABC transporter permease [Nocardia cyriacigeorgica]AVH24290.1 ABC transporter permease [Nocardia cyriacigeorgica]MBF6323769.1 ABC transporter permease [Nocardia cyriacigeorgica]PPJ16104.1 ABC transporter permease [Nocardia cyriacigeorgica]